MKTIRPITFPAFALAFLAAGQMALAQVSEEILKSISTPNKVETSIGTPNFLDGTPSAATASTELLLNGFHPADADNALLLLRDSSAARFRLTDTSPAQFGDVEDRQAASTAPPTIRLSQAPSSAPLSSSAPPSEMSEEDQIAEALANRLSYLWLMFMQNDTIWHDGDTLIKIGPLPVKIGLEAYYYVERDDDFGPKFQLRFLFVPVLPAPAWSRRPLF